MLFVFPNRTQHAGVSEAAAKDAAESNPDLLIRCIGLAVENGFRGENHTAQAEPALGCAFVDESLLKRMRLLGSSQSFERGDFILRENRADWHHAGADHLAPQDHGATSALRHPAAEARAL